MMDVSPVEIADLFEAPKDMFLEDHLPVGILSDIIDNSVERGRPLPAVPDLYEFSRLPGEQRAGPAQGINTDDEPEVVRGYVPVYEAGSAASELEYPDKI